MLHLEKMIQVWGWLFHCYFLLLLGMKIRCSLYLYEICSIKKIAHYATSNYLQWYLANEHTHAEIG